MYQNLLQAYEQAASATDVSLPNPMELAELDTKWADEILTKNQADRVKLEVELKTYSNNMIKESIRVSSEALSKWILWTEASHIQMAHRDLGDFYRATGDYGTSLKHYTKSREFCTTSQHVLDMCMSILEVPISKRVSEKGFVDITLIQLLIEQRNYAHLTTYVFKADAALDAATAATNAAASNTSGAPVPTATAGSKKKSAERDNVQAKLDLATALSHLGQGNYEKAAHSFLKIGTAKDLGDWVGKVGDFLLS